jgi:histone arginine demethylase JMJD6
MSKVFSIATLTSVDRRPGLPVNEFISEYLNPGIPVVIPGAMSQWKAHHKWDPSYFRDKYGEKTVRVGGKKVMLRDFMDTVLASSESAPSMYLNELNIHKEFPELLEDVDPFLSYALPDRLMTTYMPESWGMRKGVVELLIGGKGTKFPTMHYDGFHMNTFVTQIRGDKEFIFYSPDQTPYIYQLHPGSNKSAVNDVDHPDLEKFPLFAQAKALRTIVKEGDTVFLPTGWWHTTRLLTLSIAVSTNNIAAGQWNQFADDLSLTLSESKLKQTIYRTYLKMAGVAMTLSGK